jgi:hypothetical protein
MVGTEPSIAPGNKIYVWSGLRVRIVCTRKAFNVAIELRNRPAKALVQHIAPTHRRRANASGFQIKIPRVRGTEAAGVRRARALNQSSQDVGIDSCRIEHPIPTVFEDQPSDGATCESRPRPTTFSRCGRGLQQ